MAHGTFTDSSQKLFQLEHSVQAIRELQVSVKDGIKLLQNLLEEIEQNTVESDIDRKRIRSSSISKCIFSLFEFSGKAEGKSQSLFKVNIFFSL